MERRMHIGGRRLVALAGGLFALVALLLVWTTAGTANPAAASALPGLNFTMSVPDMAGCNTSQGNAQCYIVPGTTFTVNVTLGALPSDIPSYEGFDITMAYTGLTSSDNASVASWPDCGYPATSFSPGQVIMGCSIGVDATEDSTYVGLLGTNDFTCAQSGTISLRNGDGNTDLIQQIGTLYSEAGSAETLNITCGSLPAPTAIPSPLPVLSAAGSGGSLNQSTGHGATGLWLAAALLLGLAAASFSALSWRFARSR